MRHYAPLQIVDYRGFLSSHREFIVVSVGGGGEWMPERLAHEGYRAQLVSAGETTIYKVTVR
jgi:choline dehydrogenase-like flavoprotein